MNSEHCKVAVVTGAGAWIEAIVQIAKNLVCDATGHINGSVFKPAAAWMVEWP